jgi:very-short-patch-repair endonuclease
MSGGAYVPMTIAVIPQLQIGRYRADFALAGSRGGLIRFVVIECDGKAFHDGVENVTRDVNRDVAILANKRVLDVVRFDGKDILRTPQLCAQRAAQAVRDAWTKGNRATAAKFEAP